MAVFAADTSKDYFVFCILQREMNASMIREWKTPTPVINLLPINVKMIFESLNLDRLELLVAETFGEEENSILETAR